MGSKAVEIKSLDGEHRESVINHALSEWGDPIVTRGNIINIHNLQGFIAMNKSELIGAVLYEVKNGDCEIVVLYSIKESIGAGTALINAVLEMAKSKDCSRVWLITMNDNTHAIRFYQRRGFSLKAVHINAFDTTRKLKGLPTDGDILGIDDIPIKHEFEFEVVL